MASARPGHHREHHVRAAPQYGHSIHVVPERLRHEHADSVPVRTTESRNAAAVMLAIASARTAKTPEEAITNRSVVLCGLLGIEKKLLLARKTKIPAIACAVRA